MKLSITKRVKDYYIEYTTCYYDSDRKVLRNGLYDEKLLTSLARARREIISIIRLNLTPDSCLLTLTYKDNVKDYTKAYKDFYNFVKMIKYKFNIDLKYLRVIELQQRGSIHFHVVIFNSEFVNIPYIEIYGTWRFGAVHIRKIDVFDDATADRVGNYIGKYLSKSKDIALNKKIYTTSRNIKKPVKERTVVENEKLFNYYEDMLYKQSNIILDNCTHKKYIKSK